MNIANLPIRKIVIVSCVVLVCIGLFFLLSRGFVSIKGDDISSISYTSERNSEPSRTRTTKSHFLFLNHGDYSFNVTLSNGDRYIKNIVVPAFMFFTNFSIGQEHHKIDAVQNYGKGDLSYTKNNPTTTKTYDTDGESLTVSRKTMQQKRHVNGIGLTNSINISPGLVGGLRDTNTDNLHPGIYNYNTDKYIDFSSTFALYDPGEPLTVKPYKDEGFSVYQPNRNFIDIYKTDSTSSRVKLPRGVKPSQTDSSALYSLNKDTLTILTGGDYISDREGDHNPAAPQAKKNPFPQYTLKVFSFKGQEKFSIELPHNRAYHTIETSPNNKHVAVTSQNAIFVYNVETGDLDSFYLMATEDISLRWINNTEFIVTSVRQGIYKVDIRKKSAVNILNAADLRVTSLSGVRDNKIHFTAFSNHDRGEQVDPNAYILDLSKSSDISNTLIKKLPHYINDTRITYENNTFVITIPRTFYPASDSAVIDDSDKEAAEHFIKQQKVYQQQSPRIVTVDRPVQEINGDDGVVE